MEAPGIEPAILWNRRRFTTTRAEDPPRVDVSARSEVPFSRPAETTLEDALAGALAQASAAGRWDIVAQLARELEARRLAAAGVALLPANHQIEVKGRPIARAIARMSSWRVPSLRVCGDESPAVERGQDRLDVASRIVFGLGLSGLQVPLKPEASM